jgi:hypothetical protein
MGYMEYELYIGGSMENQWIGLRENLNRKPELFSHEDHGAFRLKFSLKPIH